MWRVAPLLLLFLTSWPSMKRLVFGIKEDSQPALTDFRHLECFVGLEQAINRFAFADDASVLQQHNLYSGKSR